MDLGDLRFSETYPSEKHDAQAKLGPFRIPRQGETKGHPCDCHSMHGNIANYEL